MENATKAILISGGILIALLIFSLMVRMLNNIRTMEEAKDDKAMAMELQQWNSQWEAYNKQVMYGSDVLTVINKAAQLNHEVSEDEGYKIEIKLIGEVNINEIDEHKNSIFKCKEVHYSKDTGRVDRMTFEFIK